MSEYEEGQYWNEKAGDPRMERGSQLGGGLASRARKQGQDKAKGRI